jgi:hypothetical protein
VVLACQNTQLPTPWKASLFNLQILEQDAYGKQDADCQLTPLTVVQCMDVVRSDEQVQAPAVEPKRLVDIGELDILVGDQHMVVSVHPLQNLD